MKALKGGKVMRRIVTIQDISCVGKCSLTVALPIISACGAECAIIPTAVLSTHTMFKGFTFRDLTSDMTGIAEHWKKEGFGFDCIYTGYLGSIDQIKVVSDFIDMFKGNDTVVMIDPVMADNGMLYPGFTKEFVKEMAGLIAKSDVAVPNITEGSFLLDMPYKESRYDQEYIDGMLKGLSELGCATSVLTGVSFEKGKIGYRLFDKASGAFKDYFHRKIDVSFHGTGDIFSSTAAGALQNGLDLAESLKVACDYTVKCIEVTMADPDHVSYGVEFEKALPYLMKRLGRA